MISGPSSERPWGDAEPPADPAAFETWAARTERERDAAQRLDEELLLDALLHAELAEEIPPAPARTRSARTAVPQSTRTVWNGGWLATAGSIAALIALTVLTGWLYGRRSADGPVVERGSLTPVGSLGPDRELLKVQKNGPAQVLLKDGSRAEFASGSVVKLAAPRRVELHDGSGRFKVVPGSEPFRVWTPRGEIEVLGTEFSVELRGGVPPQPVTGGGDDMDTSRKLGLALAVAVLAGRVEVRRDGERVTLSAGESRVFAEEDAGEEGRAVANANKDRQQGLRAARAALSNALGKTPAEAHAGLEEAMAALEKAEVELEDAEEAAGEARGAEGRAKAREAVNKAAAKPLDALAKVAGQAPEQARASIEQAMNEVKKAQERVLKGLDKGDEAGGDRPDEGLGNRGGPPEGVGKRGGRPDGAGQGGGRPERAGKAGGKPDEF
ncbi:MAG: hypothetical protein AMXMBFR7_41970 [Planctomycetota bacterium]